MAVYDAPRLACGHPDTLAAATCRHCSIEARNALRETVEALTAENARLRSALERVTHNLKLAVAGKPVRDMTETLHEVSAVLEEKTNG